jgi:hypothetical protein
VWSRAKSFNCDFTLLLLPVCFHTLCHMQTAAISPCVLLTCVYFVTHCRLETITCERIHHFADTRHWLKLLAATEPKNFLLSGNPFIHFGITSVTFILFIVLRLPESSTSK